MTFTEEFKSCMNVPLADEVLERMHELRYVDGYTCRETAEILGISHSAVAKHAPGRPGKVKVAPLREAFLASPFSAADVARSLGWINERRNRPGWPPYADTSRVKRTLGLMLDNNGRGLRSRRTMIDAETARLIADAIGIGWWEVMPDE